MDQPQTPKEVVSPNQPSEILKGYLLQNPNNQRFQSSLFYFKQIKKKINTAFWDILKNWIISNPKTNMDKMNAKITKFKTVFKSLNLWQKTLKSLKRKFMITIFINWIQPAVLQWRTMKWDSISRKTGAWSIPINSVTRGNLMLITGCVSSHMNTMQPWMKYASNTLTFLRIFRGYSEKRQMLEMTFLKLNLLP